MEELRDIQGLDYISAWPLAIGWWLIILVIVFCIFAAAAILYKRKLYKQSWQYASYRVLQQLQQSIATNNNLHVVNKKLLIDQLAVEIRRIAMAKTTRKSCASLTGKDWLKWLSEHDPQGFAWEQQGNLLISAQYMPDNTNYDLVQIQSLINAAKQWVKKC